MLQMDGATHPLMTGGHCRGNVGGQHLGEAAYRFGVRCAQILFCRQQCAAECGGVLLRECQKRQDERLTGIVPAAPFSVGFQRSMEAIQKIFSILKGDTFVDLPGGG